jgi:LPXTG-site transpeptidase (sortase) family protein
MAITLCMSSVAPALALQFRDVQGTRYQTAFEYLSDKQIVQGYGDNTARPYALINRAEVLKVLVALHPEFQNRLQYYQKNVPPIGLFSDVRQTEWYVPYLETAFENKIVTGYPDGSFRPSNSVTVEEALAMMVRSFSISLEPVFKQSTAIQNAQGYWYTPVINTVITRNLISKKERLVLGAPITRGQFFDVLYRLDSTIARNAIVFEDAQPTTVVASNPNPTPVYTQPENNPMPNTGGNSNVSAADAQYLSTKPFAITIPSVGIYDLSIVRPTDYSPEGLLAPLTNGVGHLFSFPGGGGKIMVYGHSSSYPWDTSEFTKIFRKINEANVGDKVYVTYNGQLYVYKVTFEETIPAEDTSRFTDDGSGEELILYTCWPPDSITQRYLVHATPL